MASAQGISRSWAEIDLGAVRHNAEVARTHSGCEVLAVVKANAYGHGAVPVARAMSGVATMFGVANLEEARELREGGITEPILLLSTCLREEHEAVVREGMHLSVSTIDEAKALDATAARLGMKAHAHVVVDSGMGRIGFPEALWNEETASTLGALKHVVWEGLASHLPSPDDDAVYTREQIGRFMKSVAAAQNARLAPRWIHVASGAGLLGYAEQKQVCNLVRPGLMLYGVSPFTGEDTEAMAGVNPKDVSANLRSVMTWKTRIALVRELPAGHGISYGRSEILKRPTKVATLACGYADGYLRQVSGKGGVVLVRGMRCPILGRITMDQMMVDVAGLPTPAQEGDEVVLLGAQEDEFISATEIAQKAGTIAWHVFTSISARVARVWE
jgi:alanine racemase